MAKKQIDEEKTLFEARLELDRRLYKVEDAKWVKLYLDTHQKWLNAKR